VELTDTAGIKRVRSVLRNETGLFGEVDTAAMAQALDAIRRAHVACLLVDASGSGIQEEEAVSFQASGLDVRSLPARDILTSHDLRIAEFASEEGRPLLVLLNKWDMVPPDARKALKRACAATFYDILSQKSKGVPLLTTNSLEDKTLREVIPSAMRLYKRWSSRISTGKLNRFLQAVMAYNPPPSVGGKTITPKFISQIATRPPTFSLNVSRAGNLPPSYQRFITNAIRDEFELHGIPIRVLFRSPSNPYSKTNARKEMNKHGSKKQSSRRNKRR